MAVVLKRMWSALSLYANTSDPMETVFRDVSVSQTINAFSSDVSNSLILEYLSILLSSITISVVHHCLNKSNNPTNDIRFNWL